MLVTNLSVPWSSYLWMRKKDVLGGWTRLEPATFSDQCRHIPCVCGHTGMNYAAHYVPCNSTMFEGPAAQSPSMRPGVAVGKREWQEMKNVNNPGHRAGQGLPILTLGEDDEFPLATCVCKSPGGYSVGHLWPCFAPWQPETSPHFRAGNKGGKTQAGYY